MNKVLFFKKYSFVIGLVLFLIILSRTNLKEVFQNIKNINPSFLGFSLLLGLLVLFFEAVRWNLIKRKQNIKYSLKDSLLMYGAGVYIGILTPGRLGELVKALYLKNDGYSLGRSFVGAVLHRIFDFAFISIFILFGSLFFLTIFQKQTLILILGIVISVLLLTVLIKTGLVKWFFDKIFFVFVPKKYQNSWKLNFRDFVDDIKIYKLKDYLIIFLITAFSWFLYYLQAYVLIKGMNIDIPFLYLAISVTVAGLITLIPISIFGIGTRDAALILLFSPFLIPKEQVIAFSSLLLFVFLFIALTGLICWFIKPIRYKTK